MMGRNGLRTSRVGNNRPRSTRYRGTTAATVSQVVCLLASLSLGACGNAAGVSSRDDIGGERYRALETATITPAYESQRLRATHVIKTVFVILMENRNWGEIHNSTSAPYINTTLLPIGAHAEQYFPGGVHPSEPNYVWLEAGDNLGVVNDAPPAYNDRSTTKHLSTLLSAVGVRWKFYQEDIRGTACPLAADGLYDPKHAPVLFFDDVISTCVAHVRPYAELAADLAEGTLAEYNFITPNLCNDMHNSFGCATADSIRNGDAWLSAELPKILASSAYKAGGAVFITWDEGSYSEAPIGMIVISPFAKPNYAGSVSYSHSSTLRTMQEIFAVQPYLRGAASAVSLADLFVTFP